MLQFACTSPRATAETEKWTAAVCARAPTVEEAEALARQLIDSRSYHATQLIAFAEVNEAKIASLGQLEASLYLKAQQNDAQQSVAFSQWHDEQ
jgi:hypothetical protein